MHRSTVLGVTMKALGVLGSIVLSVLIAEVVEAAQIQVMAQQSLNRESRATSGLLDNRLGQNSSQLSSKARYKQNTQQTEADQLFDEVSYLQDMGRWQEALEKLEQALILYRESGDRNNEGVTLNRMGFIYAALGQNTEALSYYEQSLIVRREINDRYGEGVTSGNISARYFALGRYSESLKYSEQALAISREIDNLYDEDLILEGIGVFYENLGQYAKEFTYYSQSLAVWKEVNAFDRVGNTLINIGASYGDLGQYSEALKYFELSLSASQKIEDRGDEW